MFTGLISDVGQIARIETHGALRRARIVCSYPFHTIAIGASIACGGPCLTVVEAGALGGDAWFEVDVAAETLARTTASAWTSGDKINLERSLKIGDELGGHIVTGHVDGIAEIVSIDDFDGMKRFAIRAPRPLSRFVAEKGSIALDGTSLTVNGVEDDVFSVLLIPHTLKVTTWGDRRAGEAVNLEVDLMARYAARLTEAAKEETAQA
ncbi:riboflavin synthase [Methylocella silvestris]|uniref:Riboflavin synthase n=1 Tax=Methylocella silvestris TaxID=199596 RepID=A0A2J7THT6_METSI|nr:riboflavin synthase [Methylocella silvestris]PNG26316.1 riboflavin synthase [Methylocella silvestris]